MFFSFFSCSRLQECRPLERPHPGLDPDGQQVVEDRLGVGRWSTRRTRGRRHRSRSDSRPRRGAGAPSRRRRRGRRLPEEFEAGGDDAAGDLGEAERHRLVDGLTVDRVGGGQAHAPVVPRRARLPLVHEVQPVRRHERRGPQREPLRALHLLAELAVDGVRDVDLAALEHGQPRGGVGHALEHQALHARRLAPVAVEGSSTSSTPGVKDTKRYGPAPIGAFLKPSSPTFSTYLRGHDPRRTRGRGAVEGHEVRPRLLEPEADTPGIRRLDRGHPLLQRLRRDAPVALERELDVIGRHGGRRCGTSRPCAARTRRRAHRPTPSTTRPGCAAMFLPGIGFTRASWSA